MGEQRNKAAQLADGTANAAPVEPVKAPAIIEQVLARLEALELSRDVQAQRIDALETRLGFS